MANPRSSYVQGQEQDSQQERGSFVQQPSQQNYGSFTPSSSSFGSGGPVYANPSNNSSTLHHQKHPGNVYDNRDNNQEADCTQVCSLI